MSISEVILITLLFGPVTGIPLLTLAFRLRWAQKRGFANKLWRSCRPWLPGYYLGVLPITVLTGVLRWPSLSFLGALTSFVMSPLITAMIVEVFELLVDPLHPNCQICEYDLTGNVSGICPECGTPIERESHDSSKC
jgi:uncharacterized membrane protein YdcZ (DUF606 family)